MATQTPQLVGLDHVVLACDDVQQMLDFYQQVLGCVMERSVGDLHQLRAGASLVDFVPRSESGGAHNMHHFCLRVADPDWDAVRDHLSQHGVTTEAPARRYGADGFGLSVYLTDPEGNQVELKGPPESD